MVYIGPKPTNKRTLRPLQVVELLNQRRESKRVFFPNEMEELRCVRFHPLLTFRGISVCVFDGVVEGGCCHSLPSPKTQRHQTNQYTNTNHTNHTNIKTGRRCGTWRRC